MNKIAILSNINIDPIAKQLEEKGNQVYLSGFNQYAPELINKNSTINSKSFDIILMHIDGSDLIRPYFLNSRNTKNIKKSIKDDLRTIFQGINNYTKNHDKVLFVINTLNVEPFYEHTYLENIPSFSLSSLKNYINDQIKEFALTITNLVILDWDRIVSMYGYNHLYNDSFNYLGRIKHSILGFEVMCNELDRLISSYKGKTKKVLVLDLDNTLWGGILGEDGVDGINLSEDGIGRAFRDFQKSLLKIKDYGIILTICSKNNFEDVKNCFDQHPMIVLKLNDFICTKINWNDKVSNIREIASELNLGMDSFVFIDDNPVERDFVKENQPEVSVPSFPKDPANINKWFISEVMYDYFPKLELTSEDKNKTKQYLANIKRKNISEKLDINSYISNLKIQLNTYVNDVRFLERSAQLTQKTNQFNMTTNRYSNKDIQNYIESDDYHIFNLEYIDRFNNEGIIGLSIVKIEDRQAIIDTFLMSCRVIGRNIEYKFLNTIIKYLQKNVKKVKNINAEFLFSKKNSVAKDFYKLCGLELKVKSKEKFIYHSNIDKLIVSLKNNKGK